MRTELAEIASEPAVISRAKPADVTDVLFRTPSDAPLPRIRAADAPTATFPALVSPVDFALFVPVLTALIVTAPAPIVRALPVPTRAVVLSSNKASETEASTAIPPAAPAEASVTVSIFAVAVTVRPAPLVSVAPSSNSALVVVVIKFKPTDAPMPTLPPVVGVSLGAAIAVANIFSSAWMLDVPVVAFTTAPPEIVAIVSTSTMFNASDPAIPTLLPPAPDVAWEKIVSDGAPAPCSAVTLTPAARCEPWPIVALLVALTTFTETATPIPTCD